MTGVLPNTMVVITLQYINESNPQVDPQIYILLYVNYIATKREHFLATCQTHTSAFDHVSFQLKPLHLIKLGYKSNIKSISK